MDVVVADGTSSDTQKRPRSSTGSSTDNAVAKKPKEGPLIAYAEEVQRDEEGNFIGYNSRLIFPFGEERFKADLELRQKEAREKSKKEVQDYLEQSKSLAPPNYASPIGLDPLTTYAERLNYYYGAFFICVTCQTYTNLWVCAGALQKINSRVDNVLYKQGTPYKFETWTKEELEQIVEVGRQMRLCMLFHSFLHLSSYSSFSGP